MNLTSSVNLELLNKQRTTSCSITQQTVSVTDHAKPSDSRVSKHRGSCTKVVNFSDVKRYPINDISVSQMDIRMSNGHSAYPYRK